MLNPFRRYALLMALVAGLAPGSAFAAETLCAPPTGKPVVLVLTFYKCVGCERWENGGGRDWQQSAQAQRIDFRRVEVASHDRVSKWEAWPSSCQQFARLFTEFQANFKQWTSHDMETQGRITNEGTAPRFILWHDNKIRAVEVGLNGWNMFFKKEIDALVGP